jgi:hypothetical protein
MFESVELGQTISKQELREREPGVRAQLLELQWKLRDAHIATLIIVAGGRPWAKVVTSTA